MEVKKYYDQFSKKYDAERLHGYFGFVNEMEAEALLQVAEGKSLLELGCGSGLVLERTAKGAESAVGVDLSLEMLLKAKEKGLRVVQADLTALPFKECCFDVVSSFKVLPHMQEIGKALQEAERVTRRGGFAVLEFYNSRSVKRLANMFVGKEIFLRYDSLQAIRVMLPKGLELVKVRGIRIIAPFAAVFRIPVASTLFRFLERALSNSPLTRFGSYLVVVCRKR